MGDSPSAGLEKNEEREREKADRDRNSKAKDSAWFISSFTTGLRSLVSPRFRDRAGCWNLDQKFLLESSGNFPIWSMPLISPIVIHNATRVIPRSRVYYSMLRLFQLNLSLISPRLSYFLHTLLCCLLSFGLPGRKKLFATQRYRTDRCWVAVLVHRAGGLTLRNENR